VLFGLPIFRRLEEKAGQQAALDQLANALGATEPIKAALGADTDLAGLISENLATYLQAMNQLITFYDLPYRERQAKTDALRKELLELPDRKVALVKLAMPALLGLPLNETRLDARLGNAMIALGCRRYREKQGAWPESLKELSPEKAPGFLPELPLDPFTGREYVYRKRGKGFIVYSLGENLKDEGGRRGEGAKRWDYDIVWQE